MRWLVKWLPLAGPSIKRISFFWINGQLVIGFRSGHTSISLNSSHQLTSLISSSLQIEMENKEDGMERKDQTFLGMEFFCVRWPPAHNQPINEVNSFLSIKSNAGGSLGRIWLMKEGKQFVKRRRTTFLSPPNQHFFFTKKEMFDGGRACRAVELLGAALRSFTCCSTNSIKLIKINWIPLVWRGVHFTSLVVLPSIPFICLFFSSFSSLLRSIGGQPAHNPQKKRKRKQTSWISLPRHSIIDSIKFINHSTIQKVELFHYWFIDSINHSINFLLAYSGLRQFNHLYHLIQPMLSLPFNHLYCIKY